MKHWMLAIGFVLGTAALAVGCGDSGGGGKALCIDSCEKTNECFDMMQDCEEQCSGGTSGGGSCSNSGEIKSHISDCNSGSCDDYGMCIMNTPACE